MFFLTESGFGPLIFFLLNEREGGGKRRGRGMKERQGRGWRRREEEGRRERRGKERDDERKQERGKHGGKD
jgi:hypothetical protein